MTNSCQRDLLQYTRSICILDNLVFEVLNYNNGYECLAQNYFEIVNWSINKVIDCLLLILFPQHPCIYYFINLRSMYGISCINYVIITCIMFIVQFGTNNSEFWLIDNIHISEQCPIVSHIYPGFNISLNERLIRRFKGKHYLASMH